jgi:peptidoglycan/LPS O-acetylase OafA/YrhL
MLPANRIERHYGMDWLRIAAILLLILYHSGLFFAPGTWLVKVAEPVEAVDWVLLTVQPWRMPLLFVVSGFASRALLSKSGSTLGFLRLRSIRLLLPLLFGVAIVVPPQAWVTLVVYHGYGGTLAHFWLSDWLQFRTVDGVQMPNYGHLWFVAYLWTYTVALGAGLMLLPAKIKADAGGVAASLIPGFRLLWLPLVPLCAARVVMLFTVPEQSGLLHDWISDLVYLPAFLFGFALAGQPALWSAIMRVRRPALCMAITSFLLIIAIEIAFPDAKPHLEQALYRGAQLVMAWSMILLLLGVAQQWLNRDHKLRAKISEAIFPFYLAHQTIIVIVGWWIRDSGIGYPAMFLIIAASTLAGCWLFYEVGRRVSWLRPFIGLAPARPSRKSSPAGALLQGA